MVDRIPSTEYGADFLLGVQQPKKEEARKPGEKEHGTEDLADTDTDTHKTNAMKLTLGSTSSGDGDRVRSTRTCFGFGFGDLKEMGKSGQFPGVF